MTSLSELLEREEQLQLLIERIKCENADNFPDLDLKYRIALHDLIQVNNKIIKKLLKELKRRTVG